MMDLVLISERLGDETTQNALVAAFGPVAHELRFSRAKNVGPQHQPGPPQRAVWEASISPRTTCHSPGLPARSMLVTRSALRCGLALSLAQVLAEVSSL